MDTSGPSDSGTPTSSDSGSDDTDSADATSADAGDAESESSASGDDTAGTSCEPPFESCGEDCVDISSDPAHCGACDVSCGEGLCTNGLCEPAACEAGTSWCQDSLSCEDLAVGPNDCGVCGNDCTTEQACIDGQCLACDGGACDDACELQGLTFCGTEAGCRDLMNEREHCGECNRDCNDVFWQISDPNIGPYSHDLTCAEGICYDGTPQDGTPCEPSPDFDICAVENCESPPWEYECREKFCGGRCYPCPAHHACINDECVYENPCPDNLEACCTGSTNISPCDPDLNFACICCDGQTEACMDFGSGPVCQPL